MGKKIVVVGCGAIGGYCGGHMARGGEDVTLIDAWPAHVERMQERGLQLSGMSAEESFLVPVKALHVSDVQSLAKGPPVDIAFISEKSYDTEWAASLIKPYLSSDGFVVSLQNCINEERLAAVVGWGKTLGSVVSVLGAELVEPGHVHRTVERHHGKHTVFRVGETHGRVTPRAEEVARVLAHADGSKVTTNLWGERWSKLIINAMGNGVSAITGLGGAQRDHNESARWVRIRLGSETVRVGQALGYELEETQHMDPETLARAGEGDKAAIETITARLLENAATRAEENRPSMAQDMAKGRRTETDFINGYVAAKGAEIGVPAPLNAKVNQLVNRVYRGEIPPGLDTIKGI